MSEKQQCKHPATGEIIGENSFTPIDEVGKLYDQARVAFSHWSSYTLDQRIKYISRLRKVIVHERDNIANAICQSTGKVFVEAITSEVLIVAEALAHIEKRAKKALKRTKVKTPITLVGKTSYYEYKPRGVVLVISPWNFPFQLAMVPIIEAIVSGNVVIGKPSEITPLIGKLMEELFWKAGLPKGVVQFAHGGREVGAELVDQTPNYIHFTGSVATGKMIQMEAAKKLIPTTLELGGKDPMIVFGDADLSRASRGAVWGAFSNSGQICMSVERLYVQRSVFPQFLEHLIKETEQLKQGTSDSDDLGSMTSPAQVEIVRKQVTNALELGATLHTGDHLDLWEEGNMFLRPMILTGVTHEMEIVREETFGPVLPVMTFETEEEAIALANQSKFGLSSSVWTKNIARGKRVVSKLHTGNALINEVIVTLANPHLPYGGVKEGGIGSYHGDIGMQNFCIRTSVVVERGWKKRELNWFPYEGKAKPFSDLIKHYAGSRRNYVGLAKAFVQLLRRSR